MKSRIRSAAAAAATLFLSSAALAVVSPSQPFYGEAFESFELHNLGFYSTMPNPYPVFDGKAGLTSLTSFQIGVANIVSDTRGYEVTAHNGNHFGGTPIGAMGVVFNDPVGAFGLYLTNAGFLVGNPTATSTTGVAEFFDSTGTSLGTQPLSVTVEQWKWHGWTSTTPIKSIEIRVGEVPPGAPYESVLADAMVFDTSSTPMLVIPEPASLAMIGALTLVGRRRRA